PRLPGLELLGRGQSCPGAEAHAARAAVLPALAARVRRVGGVDIYGWLPYGQGYEPGGAKFLIELDAYLFLQSVELRRGRESSSGGISPTAVAGNDTDDDDPSEGGDAPYSLAWIEF